MALHDVPAKAAVGLHRQLKIDQRAIVHARKRRAPPGLGSEIGAERSSLDVERGQANAAHRDAIPGLHFLRRVLSCNGDAAFLASLFDASYASYFFNDSGKHEDLGSITTS